MSRTFRCFKFILKEITIIYLITYLKYECYIDVLQNNRVFRHEPYSVRSDNFV